MSNENNNGNNTSDITINTLIEKAEKIKKDIEDSTLLQSGLINENIAIINELIQDITKQIEEIDKDLDLLTQIRDEESQHNEEMEKKIKHSLANKKRLNKILDELSEVQQNKNNELAEILTNNKTALNDINLNDDVKRISDRIKKIIARPPTNTPTGRPGGPFNQAGGIKLKRKFGRKHRKTNRKSKKTLKKTKSRKTIKVKKVKKVGQKGGYIWFDNRKSKKNMKNKKNKKVKKNKSKKSSLFFI